MSKSKSLRLGANESSETKARIDAHSGLLFGAERRQLPVVLEHSSLSWLDLEELGVLSRASKACFGVVLRYLHRANKLVSTKLTTNTAQALRMLAMPIDSSLIVNFRPSLTVLSLRWPYKPQLLSKASPLIAQIINKFRPSLQELDENGWMHSDQHIQLALASCPSLTSFCPVDDEDGSGGDEIPHVEGHHFGEAVGQALVASGCKLRKIDFWLHLPDRLAEPIFRAARLEECTLRCLRPASIAALSGPSVRRLHTLCFRECDPPNAAEALARWLPTLPALTCLDVGYWGNSDTFNVDEQKNHTWVLPHLLELKAQDARCDLPPFVAPKLRVFQGEWHEGDTRSLARSCPSLVKLWIDRNGEGEGFDLPDVRTAIEGGCWSKLQTFIGTGSGGLISSVALLHIAQYCPALTNIDAHVADAGDELLVPTVLRSCKKLQALTVYTRAFHGDVLIPQTSERVLPVRAHQLRYLALNCCYDSLLRVLTAPKLTTLRLNRCHGVETLGITAAELRGQEEDRFPSLTDLSFIALRHMRVDSLFGFLKNRSSLQTLSISGSETRPDLVNSEVALRLSSMPFYDLRQLTIQPDDEHNTGAHLLMRMFPHERKVEPQFKLSSAAMIALIQLLPSLELLNVSEQTMADTATRDAVMEQCRDAFAEGLRVKCTPIYDVSPREAVWGSEFDVNETAGCSVICVVCSFEEPFDNSHSNLELNFELGETFERPFLEIPNRQRYHDFISHTKSMPTHHRRFSRTSYSEPHPGSKSPSLLAFRELRNWGAGNV